MTEVKTYPVRMYLYSKISTITKTAQWIFSTKPQQEISIGGKIMKGFSSSHFIPGQQTVASKAIDTVFTNIDVGSEQDVEIIQPLLESNNNSNEFLVHLSEKTHQADSIESTYASTDESDDLEDELYEEGEQLSS